MGRASRPVAEAVGMEAWFEEGRDHPRQGLADQPIHRRRHPQSALAARGLGDRHPPDGPRPVGARVEPRADLRPVVSQPRPQLLGAHPVGAGSPGVLLDASERLGEVPAGQEPLPQARLGGVRSGVARRRGWTALSAGGFGLHPRHPYASRPLAGLAAIIVHPTSTGVLRLGLAFGPSRRPSIPPVLWPLLTAPRRTGASRPRPSLATQRSRPRAWMGIPGPPRSPPRVRPTTFLAHPPRLRTGPLMASGFASWCRLARTGPPSTRSTPATTTSPARHVFLGSRFRLRLPPHPASRRSSCPRLVVGAINLHRGLAPPSCWPCLAHTGREVLPHTAHRHRSPAGIRSSGSHRSAEAVHAEAGHPVVCEAGGPVPAAQPVLGAGQHR